MLMQEVQRKTHQRVAYGDALRFLAILLVVLVHAFADARDFYLLNNKHYYLLLTMLESVTRVAVPIFFMLTGAFMLGRKREESYSVFLKKRVLKLLVPFLLISVIYYLYNCHILRLPASILGFMEAFTSNQLAYHFWFMYAIILIYLILPFLNKLSLKLTRRELEIIIGIFCCANLLSTVNYIASCFGYEIFSSFLFSGEIRYIGYLFLGFYLYRYDVRRIYRGGIYLIGFLSLVLMPVLDYLTVQDIRTDALFTAGSIFPVFMATAVFIWFKSVYEKTKLSKMLQAFFGFTAPIIFYIYMVHVLILNLTKRVLGKLYTPRGLVEVCIEIGLEFIITFIVSYLVALVISLPSIIRRHRAASLAKEQVDRGLEIRSAEGQRASVSMLDKRRTAEYREQKTKVDVVRGAGRFEAWC